MAEFEHLEELTIGLYDVGALRFSNFEFTVKPREHETEPRPSPVYYNQRPIVSLSNAWRVNGELVAVEKQLEVRDLAVEAYASGLDAVAGQYDHLYGIPQAVTSIGGMVAYVRGESILWGRVGQKDYGAHAAIEGHFEEGDVVFDLDDVITSFGSKTESAESKAKVGLKTLGFEVMLNREETRPGVIENSGYKVLSILGLAKAMDILRDMGRIRQQEFDWMVEYHDGLRTDGLL